MKARTYILMALVGVTVAGCLPTPVDSRTSSGDPNSSGNGGQPVPPLNASSSSSSIPPNTLVTPSPRLSPTSGQTPSPDVNSFDVSLENYSPIVGQQTTVVISVPGPSLQWMLDPQSIGQVSIDSGRLNCVKAGPARIVSEYHGKTIGVTFLIKDADRRYSLLMSACNQAAGQSRIVISQSDWDDVCSGQNMPWPDLQIADHHRLVFSNYIGYNADLHPDITLMKDSIVIQSPHVENPFATNSAVAPGTYGATFVWDVGEVGSSSAVRLSTL